MFSNFFVKEHCLCCHDVINTPIGWVRLFSMDKTDVICETCQGKLKRIEGNICEICDRPFALLDSKFRTGNRCNDCQRWEDDLEYRGILTKNHSLYIYNGFLKELIAKYKYRGDYVLAKLFSEDIQNKIKEIKPEHIVPIPLSDERLYERGFNQAEAFIMEAGLTPSKILTRVHSEKQSKKSRSDRIQLHQVFKATQQVKGILVLIDDIYTTGSTLRHAAKALKEVGADTIISITIARG